MGALYMYVGAVSASGFPQRLSKKAEGVRVFFEFFVGM
jgi:hypothetical protein